MPRPRRIPATAYPSAAIQAYYSALNSAIIAWFQALYADLSQALGLRLDGGDLAPLDSDAPLSLSRCDADFNELDDELQRLIAAMKATNERLKQHAKARQIEPVMDTARARWEAVNGQLAQAAEQMAQSVNRLSQRNVDRQIEAALTDRRLRVVMGQPAFGSLQATIDRSTRANALLIKDIGEKAARDVEALVQDAIVRGLPASELRPLLQKRLNVTRSRAALIAQNQTARLESELSLLRGEAAGAIGFEWLETLSSAPRQHHMDNVGKAFPMSYRPLPRQEPHCKCGMRFIFDDLGPALEKLRATNERIKRRIA